MDACGEIGRSAASVSTYALTAGVVLVGGEEGGGSRGPKAAVRTLGVDEFLHVSIRSVKGCPTGGACRRRAGATRMSRGRRAGRGEFLSPSKAQVQTVASVSARALRRSTHGARLHATTLWPSNRTTGSGGRVPGRAARAERHSVRIAMPRSVPSRSHVLASARERVVMPWGGRARRERTLRWRTFILTPVPSKATERAGICDSRCGPIGQPPPVSRNSSESAGGDGSLRPGVPDQSAKEAGNRSREGRCGHRDVTTRKSVAEDDQARDGRVRSGAGRGRAPVSCFVDEERPCARRRR